jgi:hypothetical protein
MFTNRILNFIKDSFQTMTEIMPLSPVRVFTSGREVGPIPQINLQAPFGGDADVLRYTSASIFLDSIDIRHFSRVEKFLIGPSTNNLVNIATCDPTAYSTVGRYHTVMSRNNATSNTTLFYTVGIVSHSNLVTSNKSHQICIVPSDLTWNRIAAVMGTIFGQKRLALSVFFSTLKWTEKMSATQSLNTLGMSASTSTS